MLRSWGAEGNKVKKEVTAEVQWSQVERRGHFETYLAGRKDLKHLVVDETKGSRERERESAQILDDLQDLEE